MYHLLQFYIDISEKTLYNYVIKKGGKKMKNTTNRKNFKNSRAISVLLVVIMLFAALPFAFSVSANSDNRIVYAGGKIKATVEFAKDIPEGVPCYLFEFEYDGSSLSYSETENHWALNPLTVPHPDWDQPALSCSAFTAVGPEVKAGEKIVSFTFDVTKEINADELSFSYAEFQLYNNDATRLDSSYFAYSVEVLSQGNVPTEPETTEPTDPKPTMLGDVDGDGLVSIKDATIVQEHVAKFKVLTGQAAINADVNFSSDINIVDASNIQMVVSKLLKDFV